MILNIHWLCHRGGLIAAVTNENASLWCLLRVGNECARYGKRKGAAAEIKLWWKQIAMKKYRSAGNIFSHTSQCVASLKILPEAQSSH